MKATCGERFDLLIKACPCKIFQAELFISRRDLPQMQSKYCSQRSLDEWIEAKIDVNWRVQKVALLEIGHR